jgi:hypothetical protein
MKKTLLTAAAVSATIPMARAQVAYHEINQVITGGAGQLFIDLDTGTFANTFFSGSDFRFYFTSGNTENPQSVNGLWETAQSGGYAARYTSGAAMALTSMSSRGYFEYNYEDTHSGNWQGDTGAATAYLGIKNWQDLREGWVGIRYNDAANTITVESFAWGQPSDNLTAGQVPVPEPAETAAVMALLAGSAALYHRRRQQRRIATQPGH